MKSRTMRERLLAFLLTLAVLISGCVIQPLGEKAYAADTQTALQVHGQLAVNGTQIVDQNGQAFQLRGVSTHGINWDVGKPYVNQAAFQTIRDEWGANAIRLAMYTSEYNGYCTGGNQTELKGLLRTGVDAAKNLGMYAIIDWHVLNDQNPLTYLEQAKTFWNETSATYKDYNNVLYEICNEPNNCSWDDIKSYANQIIPIIRANDPDAIIIVGTPSWSQLGMWGHTNEVADSPLTGYSNLVYTLHFYCAEASHTQYLPAKVDYAVSKGLPVLVSEFGLSAASGDGAIDTNQADVWLNKLDGYKIGYFVWSLSNKAETASLIASSCSKTSGWTDSELTDAGRYIKSRYLARKEVFPTDPVNPTVKVTKITLNKTSASIEKGKTVTLTATVSPDNATNKTVKYSTSNEKVAKVSSTGVVTGVAAGSATITCAATDGSGQKATCKVTVTNPATPVNPTVKVTKITLNKTSASIEKGKTVTLTATVSPDNATNKTVKYSTSNEKVAKVSSTGVVTGVAAGSATITCAATDDSGQKATCKITVTNPATPVNPTVKVTKITLNKTSATLTQGQTLTVKATVTPGNATNKAVTWSSSNTKIATVSSTGKITAKASGTVTITCKAKDGSGKKATCKIRVYSNTEAYVARIYTKALGRTAEEAGLRYWTQEIQSKRRTPVAVAEEFFFAPEFTNKRLSNTEYVKVLYRTFMGREYDQAGLNYWVGRLNKGESRKTVLKSFAGCPEFQNIVKSFGL